MTISRIQRLPIRNIWKYEDRDFTAWLTDYRVCAIRKQLTSGGYKTPEEKWDHVIREAVENMVKLENSTKGIIKNIILNTTTDIRP